MKAIVRKEPLTTLSVHRGINDRRWGLERHYGLRGLFCLVLGLGVFHVMWRRWGG